MNPHRRLATVSSALGLLLAAAALLAIIHLKSFQNYDAMMATRRSHDASTANAVTAGCKWSMHPHHVCLLQALDDAAEGILWA